MVVIIAVERYRTYILDIIIIIIIIKEQKEQYTGGKKTNCNITHENLYLYNS